MNTYIRKFTHCVVCDDEIDRGKYCARHREQAYREGNRKYQNKYYHNVIKLKRKENKA